METTRRMTLVVVLVWAAVAGGATAAQQQAPEVLALDLTLEQLQERNRTALGGRAAIDALKGLVTKSRVQIEGLDSPGTIEAVEKAPNLLRTTISIPGIGEMVEGCDGEVAWSQTPDGVTVPSGAELQEALDDCLFLSEIDLSRGFKSLSLTAKMKLRPDLTVYMVDAIRPSGRKEVISVDAQSGLVVLVVTERLTDGEKVPAVMGLQDYRPVAGVMLPHTIRVRAAMGNMHITVTSIEPNPTINDTVFGRPR